MQLKSKIKLSRDSVNTIIKKCREEKLFVSDREEVNDVTIASADLSLCIVRLVEYDTTTETLTLYVKPIYEDNCIKSDLDGSYSLIPIWQDKVFSHIQYIKDLKLDTVSNADNDDLCYSQKVIDDLQDRISRLESENKHYRNALEEAFKCLIRENEKGNIGDTLFVDNFTTLWDVFMEALNWDCDDVEKIEKEIHEHINRV